MKRLESWGRFPKLPPRSVLTAYWTSDEVPFDAIEGPVLPFGCGRSYGDVCLNDSGTLIDTTHLDRFLSFDDKTGVLKCEAGVTLEQILHLVVPRGWFLPVTPGTKYVTVGGAIANDVHGKNHHRAGTFGCHVLRFELLRSTGERTVCSAESHEALFAATIGGLGLTGLILWAEMQLRPVRNAHFTMARVPFHSLSEFMRVSEEWDAQFEYTVAWVDSQARGRKFGRGIMLAGNHNTEDQTTSRNRRITVSVPFDFPGFFLNRFTAKVFNTLYFYLHRHAVTGRRVHYEPFLFPLDVIQSWNRVYGRRGFLQYQFLVPLTDGVDVVREILGRVVTSKQGAFLTVLKRFGDVTSPGLLSFPRKGLTLAIDLPNAGAPTLKLLDTLDAVVAGAGGSVYPAKDARMSSASFRRFFPQWESFSSHVDPRFMSHFWQRVTREAV